MVGGLVVLYVVAVMLIAVAAIVIVVAVKYAQRNRALHKEALEHVRMVEEQTRKEQNKIASLPTAEFHEFISNMFSRMVEISAAANSTLNDPDVFERLYAYSETRLMEYLGPETLEAIEYHYGKGYLSRYCMHAFLLLVVRRKLSNVINDSMTSDMINSIINRTSPNATNGG